MKKLWSWEYLGWIFHNTIISWISVYTLDYVTVSMLFTLTNSFVMYYKIVKRIELILINPYSLIIREPSKNIGYDIFSFTWRYDRITKIICKWIWFCNYIVKHSFNMYIFLCVQEESCIHCVCKKKSCVHYLCKKIFGL